MYLIIFLSLCILKYVRVLQMLVTLRLKAQSEMHLYRPQNRMQTSTMVAVAIGNEPSENVISAIYLLISTGTRYSDTDEARGASI